MHPEKWWILEEEIDKMFPGDSDLNTLTPEMIEELDYLSYFIKEVLWMDPPSAINFN